MADNPIIITLPYTADLDRGPVEQYLPVAFGTGDKEAHRLVLTSYRSTGIVDLTGAGVLCYVNRADKSTVVVDGEVVDGKAVVLLTEECYIVNGVVSIIVKLTMGDTRATVLWLTGNINRTRNGKLVDPGGVVPTLDALLAEIDNMRTATAEGVAAAEEAREAAKEVEGAAEEARQAIADMSRTTAPAIVQKASGDMVVITDGAERPALSLVSQIGTVQEGTGDPTPDNIRPIVGWDTLTLTRTGRNMLDPSELRLVQISTSETRWGMQYTRPGTYALHANVAGGDADYVYARVTDGSGAAVGDTMHLVTGSAVRSYAVTLEDGQTLTVWYVRDLDQATAAECLARTQVQVEMGDRTAYAPGQSTAITAALPETVYGGSLDWTTGVLTVTHEYYAITGNETVYYYDYRGTNGICLANLLTQKLSRAEGMCSHAPVNFVMGLYVWFGVDNNFVYFIGLIDALGLADVNEAKVWLQEQYAAGTPVQIAYKLAKPYTIQLTPQQLEMLKGYNTVWSAAGSTAVGYVADTKMYIDNAIAAIAASVINA